MFEISGTICYETLQGNNADAKIEKLIIQSSSNVDEQKSVAKDMWLQSKDAPAVANVDYWKDFKSRQLSEAEQQAIFGAVQKGLF